MPECYPYLSLKLRTEREKLNDLVGVENYG